MALVDDPSRASKTFGLGLCASGKYRYDTRHAADRACKVANGRARWAKRHERCDVYRCETCHGWHLGRNSPGRSR